MKTQQQTFNIDAKGNITNKFGVDVGTIVEVAKFNFSPSNRKRRRDLQSIAARELLYNSLQKNFSEGVEVSWTLNKSETGKPYLSGRDMPSISISHSDDRCACAISQASVIGIDIEVIKHRDWESYCEYAFHPEEAEWILAVSGRERDIRGLICWCRKEAMVKALGLSISDFLSEIGFSPEGGLVKLPEAFGEPVDWQFFMQIVSDDVVVAVAWKN